MGDHVNKQEKKYIYSYSSKIYLNYIQANKSLSIYETNKKTNKLEIISHTAPPTTMTPPGFPQTDL